MTYIYKKGRELYRSEDMNGSKKAYKTKALDYGGVSLNEELEFIQSIEESISTWGLTVPVDSNLNGMFDLFDLKAISLQPSATM